MLRKQQTFEAKPNQHSKRKPECGEKMQILKVVTKSRWKKNTKSTRYVGILEKIAKIFKMKQILWFRRDLRVSDSAILANAQNEVLPIFIFDKKYSA